MLNENNMDLMFLAFPPLDERYAIIKAEQVGVTDDGETIRDIPFGRCSDDKFSLVEEYFDKRTEDKERLYFLLDSLQCLNDDELYI